MRERVRMCAIIHHQHIAIEVRSTEGRLPDKYLCYHRDIDRDQHFDADVNVERSFMPMIEARKFQIWNFGDSRLQIFTRESASDSSKEIVRCLPRCLVLAAREFHR